MNPRIRISVLIGVAVLCMICEVGFCREIGVVNLKRLGGIRSYGGFQNSDEIENLARFAVEEHNKRANSLLEFGRVLKAKEQVVAGKLYHLTLEAIDTGKKKIYEAKVWVKPWINFKQLQEFKRAVDVTPLTSSDFSIIHGWHLVPTHDPEVRDAAYHAVKNIQQRSNTLSLYELLDILEAKAEVVRDLVKYNLLLKLRRGFKEEKFRVKLHRTGSGKYILNFLELHHQP